MEKTSGAKSLENIKTAAQKQNQTALNSNFIHTKHTAVESRIHNTLSVYEEGARCLLVGIARNANQTCHHESNHCYQCWMCSARAW